MALSSLHANRTTTPWGQEKNLETKSGVFPYSGLPSQFHEWEFRTLMKYDGTKDEDKPQLASKIVEGLRDEAFDIAKDLGREVFNKTDGVAGACRSSATSCFSTQGIRSP